MQREAWAVLLILLLAGGAAYAHVATPPRSTAAATSAGTAPRDSPQRRSATSLPARPSSSSRPKRSATCRRFSMAAAGSSSPTRTGTQTASLSGAPPSPGYGPDTRIWPRSIRSGSPGGISPRNPQHLLERILPKWHEDPHHLVPQPDDARGGTPPGGSCRVERTDVRNAHRNGYEDRTPFSCPGFPEGSLETVVDSEVQHIRVEIRYRLLDRPQKNVRTWSLRSLLSTGVNRVRRIIPDGRTGIRSAASAACPGASRQTRKTDQNDEHDETVNKEMKQRIKVVGAFPSGETLFRDRSDPFGWTLLQIADPEQWVPSRKYLARVNDHARRQGTGKQRRYRLALRPW